MLEDFNNLESQTTHPWTIGQDHSYDINFQVISELCSNVVDNKDVKIDSSFQLNINSNFLGKKRETKKNKRYKFKKLKKSCI